MKIKRLFISIAGLASVLLLLMILRPQVALAATGEVIDRAHIKVGDQMFIDGDIDNNFEYTEQSPGDRCADKIKGFNNNALEGTNTPGSATLEVRTPRQGNSQDCDSRNERIDFGGSRSNFTKAFLWIDQNTIRTADGKMTFKRDGDTNVFNDANSEDRCVDTLTINSGDGSATLQEREFEEFGDHEYDWFPFNISRRTKNSSSNCYESNAVNNVQLSGDPASGNPAGNPGGGSGGDGSTSTEPSCESEGGEMSWLLCPALRLADDFVGYIDEQIEKLLRVPNDYFEGEDAQKLRDTWARLRNIAYIILVPIVLVMVISTALGFNMFDAYTVKKAMPRLFAAVLFMSLSYEITTFLIRLTNDVGSGILGLMTSAFGGGDITLSSLFDPGVIAGGIFTGTVLVGVPAGFALAGIGVLLSYALVIGVVLLLAFLVLALRQFILIALILLAPLAILAWIFPGNDKLWKLWGGSFEKLLLLYPLIMILIAGGRIFARVAQEAEGSGLLETILILTAYIAPYIFIPATFKFAGGLFANLAGMVNDKSRGLFDKQRKYRTDTMKHRRERAGSESLFNPNSRFKRSAKFGNKLTSWTANPYKNLAYTQRKGNVPFLSAKGRQLAASVEESGIEQSKKLFQKLNEAGANDKTYRALSGTWNGYDVGTKLALAKAGFGRIDEKSIERDANGNITKANLVDTKALTSEQDIMKFANVLKGSKQHTEVLAANALERIAPVVASTYRDPESAYADAGAAGIIGLAAHGFAGGEDLAAAGNILADKYGMHYADSVIVQAEVAGMRSRPDVKAGYGHAIKDGKFIDGMSVEGGRAWDLLGTVSQGDIVQAKGGFLKKMNDPIKDMIHVGQAANPQALVQEWRARNMSEDEISTNLAAIQAQANKVREKWGKELEGRPEEERNAIIAKRIETAQNKHGAMRDEILLAASRYSQSPVDTKVEAAKMVQELGMENLLREHDAAALRAQGGVTGEGEGPAGPVQTGGPA